MALLPKSYTQRIDANERTRFFVLIGFNVKRGAIWDCLIIAAPVCQYRS